LSEPRQPDPSTYIRLPSSEPVWQSLGHPGVTTVVGEWGSGKTALAQIIARDPSAKGRRVFVSAAEHGDLGAALSAAHSQLDPAATQGDVVIIDGVDELSPSPTPEEVYYATQQPWLREARLIVTRRPERSVAMFRSRSTLSIGPPPQVGDDAGTPYWGDLVRLTWSPEELGQVVVNRFGDALPAQLVEDLLASDFFDGPDGGASRVAAIRRLLLSDQPPSSPLILLAFDAAGRLRILPGSALPDASVQLSGLTEPIRSGVIVPYKRSRKLWIPEAAELEDLINEPGVTEAQLQEFFEAHPHLLAGADYERLEAHPILERTDAGPLIPDFMLEPKSGGLADVLDLKKRTAKVIVAKRNRLHQAAALTEAIAQVREYRAWFEDPTHRAVFRQRYGLSAYRPSTIVVIGRDASADPYELRRLWDELPAHVRVLTYDEVLRRIRSLGTL
jgi:Shedu protein SduA, C-terminal